MSKSREEVNRIAWATIDQLPQSSVQSAGLAHSGSRSKNSKSSSEWGSISIVL